MQDGVLNIKQEIKELEASKQADYEKGSILRTDASSIGLGAVYLQKDKDGKEIPFNWHQKN